jgi:predicted transposase YdaD
MPNPFDATLKGLVRAHPSDWLDYLGFRFGKPPQVIDADLSVVSAAADTLVQTDNEVVHFDLQAGPDPELALRLLQYNVLARRQTGLPVWSVAVLLQSNAVTAGLSEVVEYADTTFRFRIVRVWETAAEEWLTRGPGLLPLAVLGRSPAGVSRRKALPELVERIRDRAKAEAPDDAPIILFSSYLLAGMHTQRSILQAIYREVLAMEDNLAYQIILEDGAVRHQRQFLLGRGTKKFGTPTPEQTAKLNAIEDVERLDRMVDRLPQARSWDALLRTR